MDLIYKPTAVRHRVFCNVCHHDIPTLQKQSHRGTREHLENLYELALKLYEVYQRYRNHADLVEEEIQNVDPQTEVNVNVPAPPEGTNCNIKGTMREGYESDILEIAGYSWKIGAEMNDKGAEIYLEYLIDENIKFMMDIDISAKLRSSATNYTLVKDIKHILLQPSKRWVSIYCTAPLELGDSFELDLIIKPNFYNSYERPQQEEKPPKSRRGRPKEYRKYKNLSTTLLNCWYNNNRNKPLSERMLQQLIDILKHVGFIIEDIPKSVYLLQKCDEFILDSLQLYEYTFNGTAEVIKYYRPEDVLRYVLNSKSLTEGWVSRSTDSAVVNHPSDSEAWKLCEAHFETEVEYSNARLVLPVLWIDGFVGELTRKKTYCAFSLTFANFSNELMAKHKSRFGIANLPPNLYKRKDEFIRDALIPFFKDLESRRLEPALIGDTYAPIVGRLFAIKGDHMAKIELAGVAGTRGYRGSFYSMTTSDDFTNLDKARRWRVPQECLDMIIRLQTLTGSEFTKFKKASGVRADKSPFWDLPYFVEDFYRNFSSCGLHLLALGIIKRLARYIGQKLGQIYRKNVSENIHKLDPPSNFDKISMSVHAEGGKKQVLSLSSGQWRTFAAASIIFNKKYMNNHDYEDWKLIMNGILSIFRATFTKQELQPGGSLETSIKNVQRAMMRVFPVDKYNFKFPNFEALIALPRQILFLGPLHFQSTEREEEMNRRRRQVLQSANRVNPASHITKVIEKERAAGMVAFEDDEGESVTFNELFNRSKKKTHANYHTFGTTGPKTRIGQLDRPRIFELTANYFDVDRQHICLKYAYNIKGFYWRNKKVYPGDEEGLTVEFNNSTVTGLIESLFVVNVVTIAGHRRQENDLLLCALRPIDVPNTHDTVVEGELQDASEVEFYPLGWGGYELKHVARVVRPSSSSDKVFVWH